MAYLGYKICADHFQVSYRYRTAREEFLLQHSDSLLSFVNDTLTDTPVFQASPAGDHDEKDVFTTCVVPLVIEVIVKTSGCSEREPASMILHDYPLCREVLQRAAGLLLGLQSNDGEYIHSLLLDRYLG